MAFFLLSRNW